MAKKLPPTFPPTNGRAPNFPNREYIHARHASVIEYDEAQAVETGDPANYYASQPGGVPNGPPVGERFNFASENAKQVIDSGASPIPQPDPEPVYSRPPFPQDSVTRQSVPNRKSLYDRPTDVSMPSAGPRQLVDPRTM